MAKGAVICIYAMLHENAKYVKHRLVREPIQQVCTFSLYFFHPGSQAFTSNHGRGLVPAARYESLHLSLALELFFSTPRVTVITKMKY